MPLTPAVSRARRVSSHLCGLMTAVTSFMASPRAGGTGSLRCTIMPDRRPARARRGPAPAGEAGPRRVTAPSQGLGVALPRPDPDDRVDRADPHLAVTDPAGLRGLH